MKSRMALPIRKDPSPRSIQSSAVPARLDGGAIRCDWPSRVPSSSDSGVTPIQLTKKSTANNLEKGEEKKRKRDELLEEAEKGGPAARKYQLGSDKTKVGHQAKFGPDADLTDEQKEDLKNYYSQSSTDGTPLERLTQYSPNHVTYVNHAISTGRPLTEQETIAKDTRSNAPDSSINHIIASGAGQNMLNKATIGFLEGGKKVKDSQSPMLGIAMQAASVAQVLGYQRAIGAENPMDVVDSKEPKSGEALSVGPETKSSLRSVLKCLNGKEGEDHFKHYKALMRIFDSPGNLRVGDGKANIKISTGFDPELDPKGCRTSRTKRLLEAHEAFGPPELLKPERLFTRDDSGAILSSSQQVPEDVPRHQRAIGAEDAMDVVDSEESEVVRKRQKKSGS